MSQMTEMLPVSDGGGLRADLAIIADWISRDSKVLDLGCGDGLLLEYLSAQRNVCGYGLEINAFNIESCVEKNINVIQADLNNGLQAYFADNSFDIVVMSQTLQATQQPDLLIEEMLRVGREGIITFPNMAHWNARMQLGLKGIMPVTKGLPNQWFNTPNVHLCTLNDFEVLCKKHNIRILQRTVVDYSHRRSSWLMNMFPNLLGEIAMYRFCRDQ